MALKKSNSMSAAELSAFCDQVALILDSGMPLYDGLETLAENNREEGGSGEMYTRLSESVTTTGSLYEAVKQDDRWPSYMAEMVGIGENSGHLQDVMRSLSRYYKREEEIRSAVVSAVTYPIVLGMMLLVIVGVMLWKVLPIFRQVLAGMGVGYSDRGSALMNLGSAVGWVVLILMAVLVLGAVTCVILLRTGAREKTLAFIRRVFPPLNRLEKKLSAARIASVLSMLLSSGFPVEEALRMTPSVLSDESAVKEVNSIRDSVEGGNSFSDAIAKTHLFESLHNRMIRLGIAAGKEDQVMEEVADIYEEQAENNITRLIGIIEPTLVAVLAIVIGAVLLAVMLPMTGILNVLL